MKTAKLIRVLLLLVTVFCLANAKAQTTVSLRLWDAGMPLANAQVSVEQGGVSLGTGFTDASGQASISVPYLQGPGIDVHASQRTGNTTRTWNLQGVVTLDARNSADVQLNQTASPTFPNMFPGNLSTTWPPTNMPSARMLQPTGPSSFGTFSPPTTNANPSLGGIDLNQILAYNNANLSATDIAGLQGAIDAMNSAGLGNSLNGYSIYVPNGNGSNTILKIPGGSSTPTTMPVPRQPAPFQNDPDPLHSNIGLSRPAEDSTAMPKTSSKVDTTQPKAVKPATKPRVKLHIQCLTGEPMSIFLDDNQVNPTPSADVVAQLPITYGLHPVVRVEFLNKSIPVIERTLTLSGNQAQYDFVVRKDPSGKWVVE